VPFVSSWFPIRTVLKTWMTGTSPVKGIWWGELREWMALVKIHHEDTENTKVPKRTAIFVLFVSSWFAIRTASKAWMTGTGQDRPGHGAVLDANSAQTPDRMTNRARRRG
jgi:hypothetical protein